MATSFGVCISLLPLLFLPAYNIGIVGFIILYGFFFTSFGIGSLSQFMARYMAHTYGFDVAFYVLTVFVLTALILSFKIPKDNSEHERSL